MSVYSLASRLNSVQIEVKSNVSKNNPAFTGTISATGAINATGNYSTTNGNITTTSGTITTTNGTITGATITSTKANNAATGGGQIYLNGSGGNRIDFANQGVNPPAFNTRSNGTRICMWSSVDATNTDYAIGIMDQSMWFSVPASTQGFNWYAGTTRCARLTGTGVFVYIGHSSDFGNGRVNITTLLTSSTGTAGRLCDFSHQMQTRKSAQ
jgi:hypothetical protein